MTEMKVDPGALEVAAGEIKGASAQLESILSGLASKLTRLTSDWEGADMEAYQQTKQEWDKAAEGLNAVLEKVGATVQQAKEEYVATEAHNASRFQH